MGEADGSRFYRDEERFVGLGKGILEKHRFCKDSLLRAEAVLREYVDISRKLSASRIFPFATEAARRAENRSALEKLVRDITGQPLEIISGKKEAVLGHLSCYLDLPEEETTVTVDPGGGSTEVVYGRKGWIAFLKSLPIGSIILTEKYIKSDPPKPEEMKKIEEEVEHTLGKRPFDPGKSKLVVFGGTSTTLSMLDLGIRKYKPELINMHRITIERVEEILDKLSSVGKEGRIKMGVSPGRADFICSGVLIIKKIMDWLEKGEMYSSIRGVRYGYFMEKAGIAAATL